MKTLKYFENSERLVRLIHDEENNRYDVFLSVRDGRDIGETYKLLPWAERKYLDYVNYPLSELGLGPKFDFEKAVKRYNGIMMDVCAEHVTIGTDFSENTEGWNIRDMVAECDYWLSCYTEGGHSRAEMRYGDEDERKAWRSETGKLSRFIDAYKPFIEDYECTAGHCSRYDNRKYNEKSVEASDADKDNTKGVLYARVVSAEICDLLEEVLDKYDLTVPSEDREGEEGEARLFGCEYFDLEQDVANVLASLCRVVKECPDVVICDDSVDDLVPFATENELYVRTFAIKVCGLFEDLLDEHDITIPSNEREGEPDESRIFGDVYYALEDEITEILVSLCEEVKATPDIEINVEDYNNGEYEEVQVLSGIDDVIKDASQRCDEQVNAVGKADIDMEI